MRSLSVALLLLAASGTASAQPAAPAAHIRAAVAQAEDQLNQAFLRGDVAAARALMAESYVDVNDDGTFDTRETSLAAVGTEETFTALSIRHLATRLYGDMAINTGTLHMELVFRGKPSGGDFLFTDVWQQRSGRWQMLASVETPTKAQQKKDKGKPKPVTPSEFKTAADVYRGLPHASDDVTSAIVAAERTLDDAFIRKDRAPMQLLLADDFVDTWDDGIRNNKQQDIQAAVGSNLTFFEISPFGTVVLGDEALAIYIGSSHNRGHYQGHDYDENLNTFDVWRREPSGWKVLASQTVASARQPAK